jgi:hypothetical protein
MKMEKFQIITLTYTEIGGTLFWKHFLENLSQIKCAFRRENGMVLKNRKQYQVYAFCEIRGTSGSCRRISTICDVKDTSGSCIRI